MKTILFMGDSITACGRNVDDPESMGEGYAMLAAKMLEEKYPGQFRFVNRGIPGDWLDKVYQRRQSDILDVKPDYMSILVGVNDVAVGLRRGTGFDVQGYMEQYDTLLCEIQEAMPGTKLMLMESFINEGKCPTSTASRPLRKVWPCVPKRCRCCAPGTNCPSCPCNLTCTNWKNSIPPVIGPGTEFTPR